MVATVMWFPINITSLAGLLKGNPKDPSLGSPKIPPCKYYPPNIRFFSADCAGCKAVALRVASRGRAGWLRAQFSRCVRGNFDLSQVDNMGNTNRRMMPHDQTRPTLCRWCGRWRLCRQGHGTLMGVLTFVGARHEARCPFCRGRVLHVEAECGFAFSLRVGFDKFASSPPN